MALFHKKKSTAASVGDSTTSNRVEWILDHIIGRVRDAAPTLEARDVETALVHARLADHYRDIGHAPPDATHFEFQASLLDVESRRRLALAVATLDDTRLRTTLVALCPSNPVETQVEVGFLGLARDIAPLTVALVRQSGVRAEEFARHFSMRLGVGIMGETETQSRERLHALDYKRLLAEAEEAKAAASEKMDRLRKKQREADQGRRRGKW